MNNFKKTTRILLSFCFLAGRAAYGDGTSDLQPITDQLIAMCDGMNWMDIKTNYITSASILHHAELPEKYDSVKIRTAKSDAEAHVNGCKAFFKSYMQDAAVIADKKYKIMDDMVKNNEALIATLIADKDKATTSLNGCNKQLTDKTNTLANIKGILDTVQSQYDQAVKAMGQYKSDLSGCQGKLVESSNQDKMRMSTIMDMQKQIDTANQAFKTCQQQANDGTLAKCQSDYQKSLAQITQLNSQIQSCSTNTAGVTDAAKANLANLSDCQDKYKALVAQFNSCDAQLNKCRTDFGPLKAQILPLQLQIQHLQAN